MSSNERTLILCDIDGVLADITHRLHFIKDKAKADYAAFYGASMAEDKYIEAGEALLQRLVGFHCVSNLKTDYILITGRPERTRSLTQLWLQHYGVMFNNDTDILMRQNGDLRPASVVKVEKATKYIAEHPEYNDVWLIDNDPSVIEAFNKNLPDVSTILLKHRSQQPMEKK